MSSKRKLYVLIIGITVLVSMSCGCMGNGDAESNTTSAPTTMPSTTTPATISPTTESPTTVPPSEAPAGPNLNIGEVYTYEISYIFTDTFEGEAIIMDEVYATFTYEVQPSDQYEYNIHYYGVIDEDGDTYPIDVQVEANYEDLFNYTYYFDFTTFPLMGMSAFSPWMLEILAAQDDFYVGCSGSVQIGDNIGNYEIIDTCAYAGQNGYLISIDINNEENQYHYEVCTAPSMAMPLYVSLEYSDGEFRDYYTAELTSYQSS